MTAIIVTRDIRPVPIEEEMKRSYLDYAMSVIVSRALPDVRDGLKPVHRRILFAMKDAGNDYNRPYRKSARVVGDVMGKYHPHGDSAIYEAMVRFTQDFSLRVPLIDGQGNFGSMDGDSAAAQRYTEARLSKAAHELLHDIDQDTVDFQPTYDNSLMEPKVLPARYPNLLVNGTSGIAVGMATNIPTHNLGEIIDACFALIENPELELTDLMRYVPGPDFPTGGILMGRGGIVEAFRTGRGSSILRGKTHIEEIHNNREAIVITEIPYMVNKAKMVERIAELVKEKIVEGISDLRDESDRDGVRVVIELKRDVVSDVVLNQLFKHTALQSSINYNMLALHHGRPEQLSLKQILAAFLEFREVVIIRRTRFELAKARDRAHVLVGFALSVANLDPLIALIRGAKDRLEAKELLLARTWDVASIRPMLSLVEEIPPEDGLYRLSETQAHAILELRLHRLTGLERDKINQELIDVVQHVREFLDILGSRVRILDILKSELEAVKTEFGTPRRTQIDDTLSVMEYEDLIQREDMVVTISLGGYIKRVPLATYRAQKRGGKGRSGMTTHDEDAVSTVVTASTHDELLFFTTKGRVFASKIYKLPLASPQAKGRALINILPLTPDETIATVLPMSVSKAERASAETFLMFATSHGHVRRNRLSDFANIPSNGKKAIVLDEGENLVAVRNCAQDQDVLLATHKGISNRFSVEDVRVFAGRDSNGVRGIKLGKGDHVIGMAILNAARFNDILERDAYLKQAMKLRQQAGDEDEGVDTLELEAGSEDYVLTQERFEELASREEFILAITEQGYGKRSSAYEYRVTNRGSQGFVGMNVTAKNGPVVASFPITTDDEILLVTDKGQMMRCPVDGIRITSRRGQGVIVFRTASGDIVSSVSIIEGGAIEADEEENNEATALTAAPIDGSSEEI